MINYLIFIFKIKLINIFLLLKYIFSTFSNIFLLENNNNNKIKNEVRLIIIIY